jgi:HSP20 family protein
MLFNLIPWRKKTDSGRELAQRSYYPLADIRDEFAQLFDRFFGRWAEPFGRDFALGPFWGFDVEDRDQEVVIQAEAPGFEPSELDVQVSGNLLTIKGEKKQEDRGKRGNGYFHQRRYSTFHRSITLPPGTDPDKIEARYHHGVLEVHVPKSEQAKGKRVPIQT